MGVTALGLPRALGRHFHVDEFQVAYNAALSGVHHTPGDANFITPVVVCLGWLLGLLHSTRAMLGALRLCFFALFLLNLIACAWAQRYFTSRWGRLAVLVGATFFHPLWLNGFEIRQDVLVVGGSIFLYGLAQRLVDTTATPSRWWFVAGGVVSALMQTNSIKAVVYWLPFATVVVGIGVWRARASADARRARPVLGFFAGFAAGVVLTLVVLAATGRLSPYRAGFATFFGSVGDANRFSPTPELLRLAFSSPLVFGFALVDVMLVALAVARRSCSGRSWVTAIFLCWALVAVYLNPSPYPYNFVHVLPFVFFAALDAVARVELAGAKSSIGTTLALGIVTLLIFVRSFTRDPFLTRSNEGQLSYIQAAEALTSPDDTVLDAVGLVLTRRPPHADWMLHSQWMAAYRTGRRKQFADIMAERPSPVIIDNYRWTWLSDADLQARNDRYVRVDTRMFVLGRKLSGTSGEFVIHRAGRYRVDARPEALRRILIDGRTVPEGGIVEMGVGPHTYEGVDARGAVIHWIGPNGLDRLPQTLPLGSGGEAFFTNEPMMF